VLVERGLGIAPEKAIGSMPGATLRPARAMQCTAAT
jgi:hypothetical protein